MDHRDARVEGLLAHPCTTSRMFMCMARQLIRFMKVTPRVIWARKWPMMERSFTAPVTITRPGLGPCGMALPSRGVVVLPIAGRRGGVGDLTAVLAGAGDLEDLAGWNAIRRSHGGEVFDTGTIMMETDGEIWGVAGWPIPAPIFITVTASLAEMDATGSSPKMVLLPRVGKGWRVTMARLTTRGRVNWRRAAGAGAKCFRQRLVSGEQTGSGAKYFLRLEQPSNTGGRQWGNCQFAPDESVPVAGTFFAETNGFQRSCQKQLSFVSGTELWQLWTRVCWHESQFSKLLSWKFARRKWLLRRFQGWRRGTQLWRLFPRWRRRVPRRRRWFSWWWWRRRWSQIMRPAFLRTRVQSQEHWHQVALRDLMLF